TPASFPRAAFADLAGRLPHEQVVVLDVRRDAERAAGYVRGSVHIPLHTLGDGSPRSPTARSGCTARAACAPRSRRPCWTRPDGTSSPSTAASTARNAPASRPRTPDGGAPPV